MDYELHVSEPWFTLIKLKLKTVEGRLKENEFASLQCGDFINFKNSDFGFERRTRVVITQINEYTNFREYLTNEKLVDCLPGIETIDEGVKVYYKYYTKQEENSNKILAIHMNIIY
jgi:ASC-1-like (ASCH) protein